MKKSLKFIVPIVLVIITVILLYGLNKPNLYVYDSKVNYSYVVPTQENGEFSVSVPFYKVYIGKDQYSEFLINDSGFFLVNDEVVLEGNNITQITGGSVNITQFKLSELVNKTTYIKELQQLYTFKYGEIKDEKGQQKRNNKIEKIINKYYDDMYIVAGNIVCEGTIRKPISISNILLPGLGFSFTFDNFSIKELKTPPNVILEKNLTNEDFVIRYAGASLNGIISNNVLGNEGYAFIEGTIQRPINSIEVVSLNENCIITNEADLLNQNTEMNQDNKSKNNYHVDDYLNMVYDYTFSDDSIDGYDCIVANLLAKIRTESGEEIWRIGNQVSIVDGMYLFLPKINEELEG